jgi:hypothetical protein
MPLSKVCAIRANEDAIDIEMKNLVGGNSEKGAIGYEIKIDDLAKIGCCSLTVCGLNPASALPIGPIEQAEAPATTERQTSSPPDRPAAGKAPFSPSAYDPGAHEELLESTRTLEPR